jgi:hypothetical protein
MRGRRVTAIALITLIAGAACTAGCGDDGASPDTGPITSSAEGNGFVLAVTLPTNTYTPVDPIDLQVTLTWQGAEPTKKVWGSAGGPLMFALKQLDGPIEIGPASDAACGIHEFVRGVPQVSGYRKSGGYSDTDPNAAFYKAFFADPMLRLPVGQWRISVIVDGYLAECAQNAPPLSLNASVDVLVQ